MKEVHRPLIYAWAIFIVSEIVATLMIFNLYKYHIVDEGWIALESLYRTHVVGMPIAFVIITGHGMIVFRLLPGIRTRTVKYIHAFVHTLVIFFFIYLAYVIYVFKRKTNHTAFRLGDFHVHQAYMTMTAYCCQHFFAVFIFIYMYSNQRRRKLFSAWHNFIGICILQLSIATSCCMLQWEEHHALRLKSNPTLYGAFASALMVIYGTLINIIVLNPFLEWPLVGPI